MIQQTKTILFPHNIVRPVSYPEILSDHMLQIYTDKFMLYEIDIL